jgi:hypothetical protein
VLAQAEYSVFEPLFGGNGCDLFGCLDRLPSTS